eukprot:scaffold2401_cov111-Cylindrotheca_fusiformis.AAC.8
MNRPSHATTSSQPAGTAMERIWFNLHHRVCHFWMRNTSGRTRRLFEHFLLLGAILCFGLLIIMHKNFVFRINQTNCASACLSGFKLEADLVHLSISSKHNSSYTFLNKQSSLPAVDSVEYEGAKVGTCDSTDARNQVAPGSIEYSFSSKTKGYLFLEPNDPLLESLTVQYVVVSAHDLKCFGDGPLQFLIWNLGIGWDTILLNWLLVFKEPDQPAYVYHSKTKRLLELELPSTPSTSFTTYYLRVALAKIGVLIQTSFLFFFCTTLVSFTLNETQERMLEFTQELSIRVGQNLPLGNLVTTHVLNSLIFCPLMVGEFFFLIEFYHGDRFLAFLFMSLVWCAEVYTVLSLRSFHGITYFPRLLFLLFCLFHIYYFANPQIGFSYIAFSVAVLFIVHSMIFFWHRYELPAVAFGYINIQRPRANSRQQPEQPVLQTPPRVQRTTRRTNAYSRESSYNDLLLGSDNLMRQQSGEAGGLGFSHPSFSSTTSSSSYRNSYLFRPGINDRSDEDDASFDYFLQGEVVVHRNGQQSEAQQDSTNSGECTRSSPATVAEPAEESIEHPGGTTDHASESDERSGLQAILEVRLTPRHAEQSKTRGAMSTSPPIFPVLPP